MKKKSFAFVLALLCCAFSIEAQKEYNIRLNNGLVVTGHFISYKQDSVSKILLVNKDTLTVLAKSIIEFSPAVPLFAKRTSYREKGRTRYYFGTELSGNFAMSGGYPPSHGYGVLVSTGAFVNGMTMAGIGTGIESYVNYSGIVPVFLEVRQSILPTKFSPIISASGGLFFSVNENGPDDGYFVNPQLGFKISGKRREWFMVNLGYKYMGSFDGDTGLDYLTCRVGFKF